MMALLFSAIFMMNGKPVPANNHYVPPITYQTNRFEARLPSLDSHHGRLWILGAHLRHLHARVGFQLLVSHAVDNHRLCWQCGVSVRKHAPGEFPSTANISDGLDGECPTSLLRTLDARQIQGTRMEEVLPHLRSRQFHHSEHGDYPPLPHDDEEKIGARMMMEKVTN